MQDGVVFLLCGVKFAERIALAMHSARQFWHGEMSLYVTDDECERVGGMICEDYRVNAVMVRKDKANVRGTQYATKTILPTWSDYDRTLFLDGDTLTVGPIDDLFGDAPLTITQFADWVSTGNRMSKRIAAWRGISPMCDELIRQQLSRPYPAINTGVYSWYGTGGEWAACWSELTLAGNSAGRSFIADEIAMQILHPTIEHCRVMDSRFNNSPKFQGPHADTRIWHFHGDQHLKPPKSRGWQIWWPAFRTIYEADVGGLRSWAGRYDPWVKGFLECPHRS